MQLNTGEEREGEREREIDWESERESGRYQVSLHLFKAFHVKSGDHSYPHHTCAGILHYSGKSW